MKLENLLQDLTSISPSASPIFQEVSNDELIQTIKSGKCTNAQTIRASCLDYKNTSDRFIVSRRVYTQQYSQIYFCRLQELKKRLNLKCKNIWPDINLLPTIGDVANQNHECIIIGTVYKDMKLKPSVLDEYMKDLDLEAPTNSYLSDTDRLYLEDAGLRISLKTCSHATRVFIPNEFVTGLVIACRGKRDSSGEFIVTDWILPGVMSSPILHINTNNSSLESRYVGFVSGLNIGHPTMNYEALLRLRDFLLGSLGSKQFGENLNQLIIRLVVVGDTIYNPKQTFQNSTEQLGYDITPIKTLDEVDLFFAQLASSVYIDLIPGSSDPTSLSIPQQPIHPALFTRCRHLATFQSVTNPYSFEVNGTRFLGISGQSVEDIKKYSSINDSMCALQLIVEAQCLCPTAPDTLPCYPFVDKDPFCLPIDETDAPHVIFSGCHESFGISSWNSNSKTWDNSQTEINSPVLLSIPQFNKDPSLILIDINSLKVFTIKF